ncbi:MAG: hypothetical protein ACKO96_24755, partial [Flammeovirgaceae bacterium]
MSKQFTNMLHISIFVPFLHPDTPKPESIPKDLPVKEDELSQAELITRVLNYRNSMQTGTTRKASVSIPVSVEMLPVKFPMMQTKI